MTVSGVESSIFSGAKIKLSQEKVGGGVGLRKGALQWTFLDMYVNLPLS
jgi:hypothetical protein